MTGDAGAAGLAPIGGSILPFGGQLAPPCSNLSVEPKNAASPAGTARKTLDLSGGFDHDKMVRLRKRGGVDYQG